MQKHTIDFSLQAFPTLDLVSIILPNLRTALWGFWHPLVAILQHRFKVLQKNSPFLDAFWLLYVTQFYSLDPCFLHHPSASTPHIYFYFKLHYYSAKSLAQRNSSTTSPKSEQEENIKKNLPPCSSILPLILPSTINYANLSSMQSLPPPSIVRRNSCSP